MDEIVLKKLYEILPQEDIDFLVKFDEYEKKAKVIKDSVKEQLKELLLNNNLDFIENEQVKISYVKPSVKRIADVPKLKEQGLFEEFSKESNVKDTVRIDIKYEEI